MHSFFLKPQRNLYFLWIQLTTHIYDIYFGKRYSIIHYNFHDLYLKKYK